MSQDESSYIGDGLEAAGFKQALEQTMSSRDFSAAAVRSLADNLLRGDDSASMDLVKNLLNTAEAKDIENEVDFHIETSDVVLSDIGIDQDNDVGAGSSEESGPGRYKVRGHLGSGAAGQVFSVQDNNFDREVAVKFLHQEASHDIDLMTNFVNEAKLSASLEHPNILPIHDVNISDGGMLYFSMQKAKGLSLKEELDFCREQEDLPSEIRDLGDRAAIMIKVCDAIDYAHSKNIIHQDIKPANIMIGKFGEVVVVDWGTAAHIEEMDSGRGSLVGTPIYMAPEQARRASSTKSSDIYCLGATFFHMLTLRFPTWTDDIDSFWEMKQLGIIQAPSAEECRDVPRQLLSIACKAIASDPAERYATVSDMIEDLKAYQEGRAINAHRDTVFDIMRRVYRHNKRVVWIACVAVCLASVVSYALYQELLKSESQWQVYDRDDFNYSSTAELSDKWVDYSFRSFNPETLKDESFSGVTGWRIENNALFGSSVQMDQGRPNLTYKSDVPGDIRVELDYTPMSENTSPLNVYIAGSNRFNGYQFHQSTMRSGLTGFYLSKERANSDSSLGFSGVMDECWVAMIFKRGQTYHYIVERDGNSIRVFIDDVKIIDVYDIDVLTGPGHQQFGLEPPRDCIIDNLVVYSRPLAQHVSPLSVANAYFRIGDYSRALQYYHSLIAAYPGTEIETKSIYRIGRCYSERGEVELAARAYQRLLKKFPQHWLSGQCYYELGICALLLDDIGLAETYFQVVGARAGVKLRRDALVAVVDYYLQPYADLNRTNPTRMREPAFLYEKDMASILLHIESEMDRWSKILDTDLISMHYAQFSMGYMWIRLGAFDHVMKRYADGNWHYPLGEALRSTGQFQKIVEFYPNISGIEGRMLLELDRQEEYEKEFGETTRGRIELMKLRSQYDEILQLKEATAFDKMYALIESERYAEALDQYPDQREQRLHALLGLERYDEILADSDVSDMLGRYTLSRGLAMILNGQENMVLESYDKRSTMHSKALSSLGLKAWRRGNRQQALAYFDQVSNLPFDYWLPHQLWIGAEHFVFPAFMHYLDNGNREAFERAMDELGSHKPCSQVYTLQVIRDRLRGGTHDDTHDGTMEFQLTQRHYGDSVALYDAMKLEIDGKKVKALEKYKMAAAYFKKHQRDTVYMFIQLRIDELSQ